MPDRLALPLRAALAALTGLALVGAGAQHAVARPVAPQPAATPVASCAAPVASHHGRFGGMGRPSGLRAACGTPARPTTRSGSSGTRPASTAGDPAADGVPPLRFRGGKVMGATGPVVVTPIYWAPTIPNKHFSFPTSYMQVINTYIQDVATDSGKATDVFSTLPQYSGTNGRIAYDVTAGDAIVDTTKPVADTSGYCQLEPGAVYRDGSGNKVCISDDQLISELHTVVADHGLPVDINHVYVVMTPKGVQTCDFDSSCSVNPNSDTFAYCGYHSEDSSTLYAHLPFSANGQGPSVTCNPDPTFSDTLQAPNGDADADSQISILSHEVSEAITDPYPNLGWTDAQGNENGDLCNFTFGALHGTDGAYYNQTVNGHHYLTQKEWSNDDYVRHYPNGCVQQDRPEVPLVTRVSASSGPVAGGQTVTLTGADFSGTTAVSFGNARATSVTVVSGTRLTARTSAHPAGAVHVYVTNATGPSVKNTTDIFTFRPVPAVTRVSPNSGPTAGGKTVTVTGTGFTGVTKAVFGATAATILTHSATQLTLRSPAHYAALMNVHVVTSGGISPSVVADRYTYRPVPTITRVSPARGSHAGGTAVTITGTGFTAATRVSFGSALSSFTVVSSTQIRTTAPAHIAGTVNVYVTTSGGHNPAVAADRYTFV